MSKNQYYSIARMSVNRGQKFISTFIVCPRMKFGLTCLFDSVLFCFSSSSSFLHSCLQVNCSFCCCCCCYFLGKKFTFRLSFLPAPFSLLCLLPCSVTLSNRKILRSIVTTTTRRKRKMKVVVVVVEVEEMHENMRRQKLLLYHDMVYSLVEKLRDAEQLN